MLNKVVRVYVPGTIDANKSAENIQAQWTQTTLERLAVLFGGATAIKAEGAWVSDTEGLIVEPVVLISSFCDENRLKNIVKR